MSFKYSLSALMVAPLIVLLINCSGNSRILENTGPGGVDTDSGLKINLEELAEGSEIKASGLRLINNPVGLVELTYDSGWNDSILVVAVHGYQSSGYEWVTGLKNLGKQFGSLFFFRYDWTRCPDEVSLELANSIKELAGRGSYQKVLVFGHSYGGVIAAQAAAPLGSLKAEIHIIAAPLAGFKRLTDNCKPLEYGVWANTIEVIQHKTVKDQDGAFREMDVDPQDIDLPFQDVRLLPPTMDGHRLGHNWSVTWVLDSYVGKAHRL
jgi:pimeloyl-ACP methyl ester carboxylesterase